MYGKTVYIGDFEVFVFGSPSDADDVWILKARKILIEKIKNADGRV